MKVGELVKMKGLQAHKNPIAAGIVTNIWKNHKNQITTVDVLIPDGSIMNFVYTAVEAISV